MQVALRREGEAHLHKISALGMVPTSFPSKRLSGEQYAVVQLLLTVVVLADGTGSPSAPEGSCTLATDLILCHAFFMRL